MLVLLYLVPIVLFTVVVLLYLVLIVLFVEAVTFYLVFIIMLSAYCIIRCSSSCHHVRCYICKHYHHYNQSDAFMAHHNLIKFE